MDTIHTLYLHLPSYAAGIATSLLVTTIVLLIEKSRRA
jgi:hypothetical protein